MNERVSEETPDEHIVLESEFAAKTKRTDASVKAPSEPLPDLAQDLETDFDGVDDRDPAVSQAERGLPSVNRPASVQGRITRVLGALVFGSLAFAALGWYYTQTATRASRENAAAEKAMRERATGESTVPPLGRIDPPVLMPTSTDQPTAEEWAWWNQEAEGPEIEDEEAGDEAALDEDAPWAERVLARPTLPRTDSDNPRASTGSTAPVTGVPPGYEAFTGSAGSGSSANPVDAELARRLSGEVFQSGAAMLTLSSTTADGSAVEGDASAGLASSGSLEARLSPTVLEAAQARRLPTRRLLLPKGAMLDCTLETAIDSSLPGLVTCVLAQPSYGADGRVVLLERGTKLIGEVGGEVRRGQKRLFVVWQEARTPTGIVVTLGSPGTDALGRSGLTGEVDRHFGERFGAAILLSVIDGAIQAGVESSRQGDSSSIVVSPSGSRDLVGEVLEDSIGIPPTITVAPGTRVKVLVARDLDFRSVYALERVAP
jgi:type IV secretion system protein VirB10